MNAKAIFRAVQARQGAHIRSAGKHDAREAASLIKAAKSRAEARGASLDAQAAKSKIAGAGAQLRSRRQS
jgi:hypothetical protein